jgi:hypothetical protein
MMSKSKKGSHFLEREDGKDKKSNVKKIGRPIDYRRREKGEDDELDDDEFEDFMNQLIDDGDDQGDTP